MTRLEVVLFSLSAAIFLASVAALATRALIRWARGGHVIELQVGPRSLLRDCSCGRAYLTPPAGVVDPGQCWVCRKLGEVTR